MRVGLTSVTLMLRDTSSASRTVDFAPGSMTRPTGRARASSSRASASSSRAGGTWRRKVRPCAACAVPMLLTRSVTFTRLRSSHRYSSTSNGNASIHHRC